MLRDHPIKTAETGKGRLKHGISRSGNPSAYSVVLLPVNQVHKRQGSGQVCRLHQRACGSLAGVTQTTGTPNSGVDLDRRISEGPTFICDTTALWTQGLHLVLSIWYNSSRMGRKFGDCPAARPLPWGGLGMPVSFDSEVRHGIHEKNAERDVLGRASPARS
jgi:hypothetical protein